MTSDELVTNEPSDLGVAVDKWSKVTTLVCLSPFAPPGLVSVTEGTDGPSVGPEWHIKETELGVCPGVCAHKALYDEYGNCSMRSCAIGGETKVKTASDGDEKVD